MTWEVGAGRSLGEGNLRSWRTEKNDTAQRRRDNLRKSPALGATFPSRVTLVSTVSEIGLARLGQAWPGLAVEDAGKTDVAVVRISLLVLTPVRLPFYHFIDLKNDGRPVFFLHTTALLIGMHQHWEK